MKIDWDMRIGDLIEYRDLTAGEFYQAIKQRLKEDLACFTIPCDSQEDTMTILIDRPER